MLRCSGVRFNAFWYSLYKALGNWFAGLYQLLGKISLQSQHLLRFRSSCLDVFYKKVILKILKQENNYDGDIFNKAAVLGLQFY